MFRIGGVAEGLTSGLAPRQGYQGTNNAYDQRVLQAPRRDTGVRDFLINFGLDLASRSPSGGIFSTAAAAAKDPFAKFQAQKAAGEEREYKRAWEQQGREEEQERFEEEMGLRTRGLDIGEKQFTETMGFEEKKFEEEMDFRGKELSLTRDFNEWQAEIKDRELTLTETLAGEEIEFREKELDFKEEKLTYEEKRDKADRALQKYLGELEAKGEKAFLEEKIDEYWDAKISAETDPDKIKELKALKAEEKRKVIISGFDVSDKYAILRNSRAFEEASDLARMEIAATINPDTTLPWHRNDPGYAAKVIELTNKFLKQFADFLEEEKKDKKATGGRVGYQNAGAVMPGQPMQASMPMNQAAGPTDQETNQINISYEQLRERLPQEISDRIVLLLSQSYEAFADFAEIQTQADVNEFNTKYNVQLLLPKQAEA